MARPKSPASMKSGNSETKEELKIRALKEEEIKGNTDLFHVVPKHLDSLAQKYYEFIVTELEISKLLSNLDIPLLENISVCLAQIRKADRVINNEGMVIVEESNFGDKLKSHPMVSIRMQYSKEFRAMATQLGLSPSSRATLAGLQLEQEDDRNDPLLQILSGGKSSAGGQ